MNCKWLFLLQRYVPDKNETSNDLRWDAIPFILYEVLITLQEELIFLMLAPTVHDLMFSSECVPVYFYWSVFKCYNDSIVFEVCVCLFFVCFLIGVVNILYRCTGNYKYPSNAMFYLVRRYRIRTCAVLCCYVVSKQLCSFLHVGVLKCFNVSLFWRSSWPSDSLLHF